MKKIILILLTTNLVSAAVKEANVKFTAVGKPSFIRIKGESNKLASKLKLVNNMIEGELTFDLDTLNTGLDLRDEHMKENYLQTKLGNNRYATLKITNVKVGDDLKFKALLSLHGVEKEVEVEASIDKSGKELEVDANFEVKLSEYKIDIPSFQGITVADTVKINVSSELEVNE